MNIEKFSVSVNGYVYCKSCFYTAKDGLSANNIYEFYPGINRLNGEIDSNNWAISYCISMFAHRPQDFVLFADPIIQINNVNISVKELSRYSCYMDELYPLFAKKHTIKRLISTGLKKSKLNYTPDDIKNLFQLDSQRFDRPISCVGNEKFRAMAAIGFSENKKIFCFPWMSQSRFQYYHNNMTVLLDILSELNSVCILPIGNTAYDQKPLNN